MLPDTTTRVASHTADHINEEMRRRIKKNVERYIGATPMAIDRRLEELDAEWNTERTLEANAATLALVGTGLGAFVNRKWLILPGLVTAFLLQHALQGWCPPLSIIRRMGVRTPREIEIERNALKVLRGDYRTASDEAGENRADPRHILHSTEH